MYVSADGYNQIVSNVVAYSLWYYFGQCNNYWLYRYPPTDCPAGTRFVGPNAGSCLPSDKPLGPRKCNIADQGDRGNPCNAATGNKYQPETDSTGSLDFNRYYNSLLAKDSGFGWGWTAPFGSSLAISGNNVHLQSGDGHGEYFVCYSGVCTGDPDTTLTLVPDATGYTLTHRNKSTERYDLTGALLSDTDTAGKTTNYSYTSGKLSTVTDPFGHALNFGYNGSHIATITNAAAQTIGYSYDANNNLVRVDYPDATAKLYHYEDANNPHGLTGISYVDANNVTIRFSTYGYDATTGKAFLTQHAQTDNGAPQESFALAYNSDTQTTVTDPIGMNEVMTFAANLGVKNLVGKVNQTDGKSLQQTFDANNNLTCRKDEANRVTLYSYNPTNQKLSATEGLSGTDCNTCLSNPASCNTGGVGRTTTYAYVSTVLDLPRFIRKPSVAPGQTFETEIQYNDVNHPNLPTNIIQRGYTPSGTAVTRAVSLGYNASGQVNVIDGPRTDVNDITTLNYNACTTGGACGQLHQLTNAVGHVTTYDNYDPNGRLLQMTDPNGLVTTYTYDPRGRVKTITQTPATGAAAIWQYRYTPWGDVSQVIDPDGVILTYGYDAAHYLRTVTDALGDQIRYRYDLKGNRTQEYTYHAVGTLTHAVDTAYDLRNHVQSINEGGNLSQQVADAIGNLLSETDANANPSTTHQYDALNRLTTTLDRMGQTTIYAHDINDRITGVTAPLTNTTQAVTQYSYDDLGNQLQEVSPDRGARTYTYDAAGNVLSVTDVLPRTTSYTYDALNRILTQQSSVTSTPRYTYLYDGCGLGRLCMIQRDGNFHLYFAYDDLGRQNFEMSNNYIASAYVYSPGGRLAQITTYPGGRTVDYLRNSAGQVTTVQTTDDAGVTTPLAQNIDHYPFGPLFYLSLGGTPTYYLHDTAYRINYELSTPWLSYLTRDPNGNILSRNTFNGGGTQGFTYDALDRLTQATDSASTYPALGYSYDANGNRLSETRASTTTNYGYQSSTNKLAYQGFEARLTNPAGETIYTTTLGTLTYDGYGRLTQIGTTTYTYDAFNRRQRKTNSSNATTTLFHYLPTGELLIESQAGATQQHVYLDSRPLARIDGNQLYYYHTDNLGTPRALTDSNGTTVWLATYEPFGNATVMGNITNNLRMAGQYYDQETGLHYNNARYYDPKVGRYISSDPIGLAGGLNTYLYAKANPLRYTDPTGLVVCSPDEIAVEDPNNPGVGYFCKPRNPVGPPGDRCVTAECAAGVLPNPPPVTVSPCELKCSFAMGAACKPVAVKTPGSLYSKAGSYAACEVAAEYLCRKACQKAEQCSADKK